MKTDELSREVHQQIQNNYFGYIDMFPKSSPTERLIMLNRLYEMVHYGVTSRDLKRGYQIRFEEEDGKKYRVKIPVKGHFRVGGDGNNSITADPICMYRKAKLTDSEVSKGMTEVQYMENLRQMRKINLAAEEHTTATDILGQGEALLEHGGIDSGFGATAGVIDPVYVDLMLRLISEEAQFKNFVNIVPMRKMTFYYPIKTSVPSDDTSAVGPAIMPTLEGRAGLEFAMSFSHYNVNGWKYLRHAGLTLELIDLLKEFIDVRREYINDLAIAMGLLWDYTIAYGMRDMILTGYWRRPDIGGPDWTPDETEIPFGKASVLAANAKANYLFQDLTAASANYGKIYEPLTGDPTDFLASTLLAGSSGTDELFELLLELANLYKVKTKGQLVEFFAMPAKLTRLLMRDSRFLDVTQNTGNPAFANEKGYLGQISIGGSNQRVDIWEYSQDILPDWDDPNSDAMTIVLGGAYKKAWNQGVYSPFYVRVDEGREVVQRGTGNTNVTRDNETRVITVGSKGSSWPGDYHNLVLGLVSLGQAHG